MKNKITIMCNALAVVSITTNLFAPPKKNPPKTKSLQKQMNENDFLGADRAENVPDGSLSRSRSGTSLGYTPRKSEDLKREPEGIEYLKLEISTGNLYAVRTFLEINTVSHQELQSLFEHAVFKNEIEIVKFLCTCKGLDVNGRGDHLVKPEVIKDGKITKKAITKVGEGVNPLSWALFNDNAQMVGLLLAKGAKVEGTINHTPVHWAAENASLSLIKKLYTKDPKGFKKALNTRYGTMDRKPIDCATKTEIIQFLRKVMSK